MFATPAGNPMGNHEENKKVELQNILVSRVSFLLLLCHRLRIFWAIEQPRSSILFEHRRLNRVINLCGARIYTWDMGAFGAHSLKPQHCVGTWPGLSKLHDNNVSKLDRKSFAQKKREGHQVLFAFCIHWTFLYIVAICIVVCLLPFSFF